MRKKIILFVVIAFELTLFVRCGDGTKIQNANDTVIVRDSANENESAKTIPAADTSTISTSDEEPDSVYAVNVNGLTCEIIFSHELPSSVDSRDLSTTVQVVQKDNHDTLYKKTFDFNTVGRVVEATPDIFFIDLYNTYGGSGFTGMIFNLRTTPEISLRPVSKFDELTYWKSNDSGTQLLLFDGIWNMNGNPDGPNFETHFSDHQQWISTCDIKTDTVITNEIGTTKFKYAVSENEDALKDFRKKEPGLAKKIKWEDFGQ